MGFTRDEALEAEGLYKRLRLLDKGCRVFSIPFTEPQHSPHPCQLDRPGHLRILQAGSRVTNLSTSKLMTCSRALPPYTVIAVSPKPLNPKPEIPKHPPNPKPQTSIIKEAVLVEQIFQQDAALSRHDKDLRHETHQSLTEFRV